MEDTRDHVERLLNSSSASCVEDAFPTIVGQIAGSLYSIQESRARLNHLDFY